MHGVCISWICIMVELAGIGVDFLKFLYEALCMANGRICWRIVFYIPDDLTKH